MKRRSFLSLHLSLGREFLGPIALAVSGFAVSGCVFFRSPETPMAKEKFSSPKAHSAKHLAVFLPGLGDDPQDVVDGGLIDELKLAPQFDAVIADAHFGYYKEFVVLERLHADVIAPLRKQYDEMWIIGISMGGYGAVSYAERYPEEVTGVVLLAPYMGEEEITEDIEKAGSLSAWDPQKFPAETKRTRHGVKIWTWLKQRPKHVGDPTIYLGCGEDDSHMRQLALLRPVLQPDHILVRSGGHDWDVWRPLFHDIVGKELSQR
jgi:pimeloyl-ACP methyl ester carboxylesterase